MGKTAVPSEPETRACFRWKPAETAPEICLRWSVMLGIEAEVIEGFKALPKRGVEVGGALFGYRGAGNELVIEGWRPVEIEHRSGPSYVVSDDDLAKWREAVKSASAAGKFIGIYRSQTRPGLNVSADDCAIVEKFLPRDEGVLLIVKPLAVSESVATFYLCEGGAVVDEAAESREFAFGRKAIPADAIFDDAGEGEPAVEPSRASPARLIARSSGEKPRAGAFLISAAAIAAGVLMGVYVHSAAQHRPEEPEPASFALAADGSAGLHLRAERGPNRIRLMWDTSSPWLSGATEGSVIVADGELRSEMRLAAEDLNRGWIEWRPASDQTRFEMQVGREGGPQKTESIIVVNSRSDGQRP